MKKFNCEHHCVISHLCMEPCDVIAAAADGNIKRREPTLRDPMRIPAANYNEELYRLMRERERGSELIGTIREMQPLSLRLIAACLHADMSIADISRAMRDLPAGESRLYEIVRARVAERESKRGPNNHFNFPKVMYKLCTRGGAFAPFSYFMPHFLPMPFGIPFIISELPLLPPFFAIVITSLSA